MAPVAPVQRKRVRKRKRRQASSSEDSSSSSSASETGAVQKKIAPAAASAVLKEPTPSSSSSSESSSSESDVEAPSGKPETAASSSKKQASRSPSPVSAAIPPFRADDEQIKDRFRQFWMGTVAEAFEDDLEQIRKEPNLTTSRLAILIDSLGEGANVFDDSSAGLDERRLVLEPST